MKPGWVKDLPEKCIILLPDFVPVFPTSIASRRGIEHHRGTKSALLLQGRSGNFVPTLSYNFP